MTVESITGLTSEDVIREINEQFAGAATGDPYPLFAERRRNTPVMHGDLMAEFGAPSMAAGFSGNARDVYSFYRYADVQAALKDADTYSSSCAMEALGPMLGESLILGLDGAAHRRVRRLVTPGFDRQSFEKWDTEIIQPLVAELVADLKETGPDVDLMDLAIRFPVKVIYRILGFPEGDEEHYEDFQIRALTILLGFGSTDPDKAEVALVNRERAMRAVVGLSDDLLAVVEQRRREGGEGNDLIAHLLRAEIDGERLSDGEVAEIALGVLPAATENTTRSWANLMSCLLTRPGLLETLRHDRSIATKVMDESLRFEGVVTANARVTTRDVVVGDVEIPAGSGVTLVQTSANRDEDAFPDAGSFDHNRPSRPPLSFGWGPHICVGMGLAKVEMLTTLNAVLDGLPNVRPDLAGPSPDIVGLHFRSPRALPVSWG